MSSLEKQDQAKKADPHDAFLATFEKNVLAMEDVLEAELLMKKLKYLGIHFDPFQNEHSGECREIMEQLGLTDHMRNPYLATNILLRLLDKTEERINNLKQ